MKRLSMLFAIIVMIAVGCAQGQVQVDPASQEAIAKIAGRRAGYELEKQYPEISHEVLALSKAVLVDEEPDIVRIVIDRLVVVLATEIDDPLLKADIKDILDMINIQLGVVVTKEQMAVVKAVAEGLISGIELQEGE